MCSQSSREKWSYEVETRSIWKWKAVKFLEIKTVMSEVKKIQNMINNRLDIAWEKSNKFE